MIAHCLIWAQRDLGRLVPDPLARKDWKSW